MKKLKLLFFIVSLSLNAIAQNIYYVKTDGSDLNDGKSWTNAVATITKAIALAEKDDEIRVAGGLYISTETYFIDKSITITGGLNENEGQNLTTMTILDGQSLQKIMKVSQPITGVEVHVVLSGLSFNNGFNNGTSNGAAIEFVRSSGLIKNCEFKNNNSSISNGGAVAFLKTATKSTIINSLFKNNSAINGGAIYSDQRASVDLINCTITQNTCAETGEGGGVFTDGTLNIYNSVIWGNKKGQEEDQINGRGKYYLDHNILQGGIMIDNINKNLQSNMVLQQNDQIKLSGYSASNHEIKISCSWQTGPNYFTTTTSENGFWSISIPTPSASLEPVTITIEGRETKQFTNILIGEVWLCSGQSNMKFRVKDVVNASAEISMADNYPNIRLLNMNIKQSDVPLNNFEEKWEVCSSSTILNFSAVAYFFGRKLYEDLNVPIGLINSSWGDTTAEVWINRDSIMNTDDLSVLEGANRNDKTPRATETTAYKIGSAYNAMIHPLQNIPIAGAIWYQGESNQGYPYYYPGLLKILVNNWRGLWNKDSDDFPFYIAQICPFKRMHNFPTYYSNPAMRYMQLTASNLIQNSEIECNDDLADLTDIHPKNKQDVGMRLAWLALNSTYNKTEYSNKKTAQYESHIVNQDQIIVTFKNVGGGLKTKDGATPAYFEICGSDKIFYPANAVVSGTNQVILTSPDVLRPVAARLGWSYVKTTNLVNSESLPVSVFKTYTWSDLQEEPNL